MDAERNVPEPLFRMIGDFRAQATELLNLPATIPTQELFEKVIAALKDQNGR